MSTGTITNQITDPSGTAIQGAVITARIIPGPAFRVSDHSEIAQIEQTTTDVSGNWSLTLEINTDITPGDSYYQIEEAIPGSQEGSRVYAIQVASGSHTLYASLVTIPPVNSPPVAYLTQSVADARYLTGSNVVLGGNIQPVGTATATGTSTTAAPSNHVHPLSPAVVGTGLTLTNGVLSAGSVTDVIGNDITLVGTNTATGTATTAASSTHQHALSPTVAGWGLKLTSGVLTVNSNSLATQVTVTGPIAPVGTNTQTGTATTAAPSNHQHVLDPAVVGSGLTLSGGVLSVTTLAPVGGNEIRAVSTGTSTGTTTTFARTNHQHTLDPAIVGNDLTLAAGILSVNPRVPVSGGLITAVDTVTATGTATTYAASNHQHPLSPGVVGNDLSLSGGVLSVNPRVPVVGGLIQPVGTATVTGTATTYAASNHAHPLSPAVVGAGLTLTAGVLSATGGAVPVGGDEIRAVSTGTSTGTTTTFARTNHQHTLDPAVISTGLLLSAGVVTANVRPANYVVCTATTTQTYVVPTGCKALVIQVVGAGAGGGGCSGSATQSGAGAGGGSGGYAVKYVTATATAYNYNCGIKGPGGTAGANDGTAGTQSVFGHAGIAVTAKGGAGGVGSGTGITASYAPGGGGAAISTGGDINESGQSGLWGWTLSATQATGGPGANSVLGGGGNRTDGNVDGTAAPSHGAGGSGGSVRQVNTARAGGNGGDGLIMIQEFYGS